ncbi:MAG: carbohydrate-binding protein [Luteolibacter sp.]|jgi:chitodextrinase|nr:carbohydrate-binding protein [Luteolibacter sp.]
MIPHSACRLRLSSSIAGLVLLGSILPAAANDKVHVSRFWHNHQPTYWPEWNSNGAQIQRVQYAWDSIVLKPSQNYGGLSPKYHPENNLTEIFGIQDRVTSYQSGPRNSLAGLASEAGFALSYSGSLMDGVRQLGSVNQLGYGPGWWDGYRESRNWLTPSGSRRMDLVGFTYHHSLAPLLPKSVLRKEIQTFKQAYWKAWGGNSNLSDHSKGFFPTEMGYSRHIVDVLVDEGYEWVVVPSHHISRTCPTYNTKANPEGAYNIYSSPPNRADQIGPSPADGWWYGMPNPGNAAWNVSPHAYQLHRVKHVNPETGAEKSMIAVPSDDVLSYRFGYANEGIGKIQQFISPFASDPARPVLVMPATDGDNAWGGGSSSWFEATPQFFNDSHNAGYLRSAPQDFVNAHGAAAQMAHIEDGAWIFPESCYGSPYFLKWIEPPVANAAIGATNRYPGTIVDMETPGFALKFYSYAPLMAGANWCETAEQILRDEGGSVEAWKIQAPYDWNGAWSNPNDVELAWHIFLHGLDSGFNYYGGLGNDDEMKPGLATRRAVEKLQPWMTSTRRNNDRTPPTVLKPQRFPYNPGAYTFGWFNSIPGGDNRYLKKMPSEFYLWTHAYDLSGIPENGVVVKVRVDADGTNPLGSNQNETYAGGPEVGSWINIPMIRRELPKTRQALNPAAANSQIDYFLPANEVADYYFAKITDSNVAGFRDKLLDYYIEATDLRGNVHKSEIQQVFVEDDHGEGGGGTDPDPVVSISPAAPTDAQSITITYNPAGRNLAGASQVYLHAGRNGWQNRITPRPAMALTDGKWTHTLSAWPGTTVLDIVFTSAPENGSGTWDNNGGQDWHFVVSATGGGTPPQTPANLVAGVTGPTTASLSWNVTPDTDSYLVFRNGVLVGNTGANSWADQNLLPATPYAYTVSARNASGDSAPTATANITTDSLGDPPATPTGLAASATSDTSIRFSWFEAAGAVDYIVYRNGEEIGTTASLTWNDSGRVPSTTYFYSVAGRNPAGTSLAAEVVQATTPASPPQNPGPIPFIMDGIVDYPSYQLSSTGMVIHAALRGDILYVSTWAPGSEFNNDHFILVGNMALPTASTASPWNKSGSSALPPGSPFLGAESSNDYIGWFNTAGAGSQAARAAGGRIEGTLNVAEAFGSAPANLHLAALAYQTADAGLLGAQAPAMMTDNGDVDPEELLVMPLEALRDEDANGIHDRLETGGGFVITSHQRNENTFFLAWNAFPGRSYIVQGSTTMAPASWQNLETVTASDIALSCSATLPINPMEEPVKFFRVVLVP